MIAQILALALAVDGGTDSRWVLLDAMAQELERNQKTLKLKENAPPYFLSYQLKDIDERDVAARYGAVFRDEASREKLLYVDARVGSYAFDSSRDPDFDFSFSSKGTSFTARKTAPLDDNPQALRTALWLITDEKYKAALFDYLKKKGEDVYTVEDPKRAPSFSKETPVTFIGPRVAFPFDRERWSQVARTLSSQAAKSKAIIDSEVRVHAQKTLRSFVSSEGSRLITEDTLYSIVFSAVARAEDGQLLDNGRAFYAPTEAGLPSVEVLTREHAQMVEELVRLRNAPAVDPYTGPAILEADAAGVLFHEAVGHRLEGHRQDDENEGKTFKGQVGKPVLPSFISIHDDPTQAVAFGQPLNGHYRYDDEGVAAQRVSLVESGVLKSYLLSRKLVDGFSQSNGHGRSQGNRRPVSRMANLVVTSTKQVADSDLKKMLLAEAKRQGKPYGLVIRDITGGNTNTSSYGYQAFKGIPRMVFRVDVRDGKETLVRGVEMVGTPLSSMNRIVATGKTSGVFNGFCGAESGAVPVSTVAPALLLQEVELQRVAEGKDRPPVLPSPYD